MSERPAEPAIEVVDLVKAFDHGAVRPLRGVNLRVEAGEWVALVGPSGCGKSTLLNLLTALDRPTSGTIRVNGRDLKTGGNLDRYRRLEVGLVFQLHNLLPNLTAVQNILVAMLGNGLRRAEQREHARELLAAVGLSDREAHRPTVLSGGERQRLAIARALANRPPVLLADEPTGALDGHSAATVLELIEGLRRERGLTLLMVTHDLDVAARADRVVHMSDGRLLPGLPA